MSSRFSFYSLFLFFILLLPQLCQAQNPTKREVTTNYAPVHISPDLHSKVIDTLYYGTIVNTYSDYILGDDMDFYEVEIPSSNVRGYVYRSYLETPEEKKISHTNISRAVSHTKALSTQTTNQSTESLSDESYLNYLRLYGREETKIARKNSLIYALPNFSSRTTGYILKGESITVIDSIQSFYIIQLPNGRIGWGSVPKDCFKEGILDILSLFYVPFLKIVTIILYIIWIILPFAIFGIKKRLDKIIELLESQKGD